MLNRSCFILALLTVFIISGCSKKTEIKKTETSNASSTTQATNESASTETPAAAPLVDTGMTTPADENDNAFIGELDAAQVQTQVVDNAQAFRLAIEEEELFVINGVINKLENFDEALIESGVAICILRTNAMSANDLNGLTFIGKNKRDEINDGYRLYVVAGQSTSGVALTTACIRANDTPFMVKEVRAAFKGIMTITIK